MLKKEREIIQEIGSRLSAYENVIKAIAYGSRIRGDNKGDSDLDILIIIYKKDKKTKDTILELFYSYELEKDLSFSVTILSEEEYLVNEKLGSPFIKSINEEGMIFYDIAQRRKKNTLALSP